MEKGNRNTVLITVIGIATLLVALVGATFAFFTASVTNNATAATVTTTQVANLTVTSVEGDNTSLGKVPGIVGYKAYQVSAAGSGSAKYNLSITLTGSSSFGSALTYSLCKVENSASALANPIFTTAGSATTFKYVPGTYSVTTVDNQARYSITGSSVALPSSASCTAIGSANTTFPTTATAVSLASSKTIASGQYDLYYLIYKYTDTGEAQDAQNTTFTISKPTVSVIA